MKNRSGIYEILNTVNGKQYIGSAVNLSRRWGTHRSHLRAHTHHNAPLQHAWNKYGEGVFKFLPILTCVRSMLRFYEQQLLDKVKPEYNVSLDAKQPMLGRKHSEETKKKMSTASKGRVFSPEHCAAMSAARIGKPLPPHSAEAKEKVSKALKGKPKTPEHCAAISWALTGRKLPPEQIERLRVTSAMHVHSAEAREKISASKRGKKRKPFTAEAKANMAAARRRENAVPGHAHARAAALRGRPHSPEVKAKQAAGVRAYWVAKRAAEGVPSGS